MRGSTASFNSAHSATGASLLNSRDEQRKIIKYGDLVAKINRFGAFFLDELRDAINIENRLPMNNYYQRTTLVQYVNDVTATWNK